MMPTSDLNRRQWLRRIVMAAGSASAAGMLSACGAGLGSTVIAVRMLDAVPGPPAIDLYVNGSLFIAGLPYQHITTYGNVNEGNDDLVGLQPGTQTAIVPLVTLPLTAAVYTVIATGVPGSATTAPSFLAFPDNNSPPSSSQVRLRVINVSPDAGKVDVTANNSSLATGLAYTSSGTYVSVSPGTFNLVVTPTGSATPLVTKTGVAFAGGHVYTIFITGLQSSTGTPLTLIVQADV